MFRVCILFTLVFSGNLIYAKKSLHFDPQNDSICKLFINVPIADYPQNFTKPSVFPSMYQATKFSTDLYELSYLGIDVLGDKLFFKKGKEKTKLRNVGNFAFKYLVGLGFSKYGSELPIPLGVWAHEEFHRSVLSVNGIASKNGNWIVNRWDGTVYGVPDSALYYLKLNANNQLLYSYVAGVHSEVLQNQLITTQDFFNKRNLYKNSLLLYNAYYVYNYFKFSTSVLSDTVKVLAPQHENKDDRERDFAGADLTAWAYDMFLPDSSYFLRDAFPIGSGVNRRIGFSELPTEAKHFLKKQKRLSVINFFNPAIFFVNRISINKNTSFIIFPSYIPTHFGNDIAAYCAIKYKKYNILLGAHNYNNYEKSMYGMEIGLYNYPISNKLIGEIGFSVWEQPQSFFENKRIRGGSINITSRYVLNKKIQVYVAFNSKSKGFVIGNPYLANNNSFRFGFNLVI